MQRYGVSRAEAETAAVGNVEASKGVTARDVALESMNILSAQKCLSPAVALAKYLETREGQLPYSEYEKKLDSISMTKAQARDALDGLAAVYAAELGIDRWRGMAKAVNTPLGRRLYELKENA